MVSSNNIINSYSGTGILSSDKTDAEMEFDIVVTTYLDSTINITLRSKDISHEKLKLMEMKMVKYSFSGDLDKDLKIYIPELYINNNNFSHSKKSGTEITIAMKTFSDFYIWKNSLEEYEKILNDNYTLEMGITNFIFDGLYFSDHGNSSKVRDWFKVNLFGKELIFQQLESYKGIKQLLRKDGGVMLTSNLKIEDCKFNEIKEDLQDLLWLISYSQKTLVSKFYTRFLDAEGNEMMVIYHHDKMYQYANSTFIDSRHLGNQDIEEFVESTFNKYKELKSELKLDIIFDIICQAELAEVLESKCLLLISALELIIERYTKKLKVKVDNDSKLVGDIQRCIEKLSKKEGINLDKDFIKKLSLKLSHPTFKNKLKTIIDAFKFEYSEDGIKRIKENRDKLVHEVQLHDYENPIGDYYDIKLLLDKIILSILRYNGYVLNYTNDYKREKIV